MAHYPVSSVMFMIIALLGTIECQNIEGKPASEERRVNPSKYEMQTGGYVDLRDKAHIFYWFYYSTHPDGFRNRPWIIWLQGGPGSSSSGQGNFNEIGPRTNKLERRNTTWVNQASVLFIDSPVGSGFSYVDDNTAYCTKDKHIVDDLMEVVEVFLNRTPIFQTRPLYIFGQSYSGKIAAQLAQRLNNAIKGGDINATLAGVAMGDAWISPVDSVLKYSDFLFWMSLVDENGRDAIQKSAAKVANLVEKGNWEKAYDAFWATQEEISRLTNKVDMYDITKFITNEHGHYVDRDLMKLMLSLKKTKLRIIPKHKTWTGSFDPEFKNLAADFMKPSVDVLIDLLENTDLKIIVYQGQLDIECNNEDVMEWIQKLMWNKREQYWNATRTMIANPLNDAREGYVKVLDNFKFYNILRAGHMVAVDKDKSMYRILERILNDVD